MVCVFCIGVPSLSPKKECRRIYQYGKIASLLGKGVSVLTPGVQNTRLIEHDKNDPGNPVMGKYKHILYNFFTPITEKQGEVIY